MTFKSKSTYQTPSTGISREESEPKPQSVNTGSEYKLQWETSILGNTVLILNEEGLFLFDKLNLSWTNAQKNAK